MSGRRPLRAFISSTADERLQPYRDAAYRALERIKLDPDRFEGWEASPRASLQECLERVRESEILVLLIGHRYGSIPANDHRSVTHQEYLEAVDRNLDVFAYDLAFAENEREPEAAAFLQEVRDKHLFCPRIRNPDHLEEELIRSIQAELTRAYRRGRSAPAPETIRAAKLDRIPAGGLNDLPANDADAIQVLTSLYKQQDDASIYGLRDKVQRRFQSRPDVVGLLFSATVNLAMAGSPIPADELLRGIEFWRKHRGEEAGGLYNIGNALGELGRHREAIESYRRSLALDPAHVEAWVNLANAHRNQQETDLARNCYEKALGWNPRKFQALYGLGTLLAHHFDDPGEALRRFNTIRPSTIPPKWQHDVDLWRSDLYCRLGQYPEGLALIADVIDQDPARPKAWYLAARLYALVRRSSPDWLGPCMEFWPKFLERFPTEGEAWAENGYITFIQREDHGTFPELAKKMFERALSHGYDDGGLVADRLGHLHEENGEIEAAVSAYRRATNADEARFGYCLAKALADLGRFDEAMPYARSAAQLHQPDALSWFLVGRCAYGLKTLGECIAAYEKAIELDPKYDTAWFNLGGGYHAAGNVVRANEIWRYAIVAFPTHSAVEQAKEFLGTTGL